MFIVVVIVRPRRCSVSISCSSSLVRCLAAPPPSSASQHRSPPRLTVGCHRRPIVIPGRRPHCRGIRPSVKLIMSVVCVSSSVPLPRCHLRPRLRVVKCCAGLVSPSSYGRRQSRLLVIASFVAARHPSAVVPIRLHRAHWSSSFHASSRCGEDPSFAAPSSSPRCRHRACCAVVNPGTRVLASATVHLGFVCTCGDHVCVRVW